MFTDAAKAERAAGNVQHDLHVEGVVHTGRLAPTAVHSAANEAVLSGILGGLVVGLAGALFVTFVIGPFTGVDLGFAGFLLMAGVGSLYGVVAGAVIGSAEWRFAIRRHSDAVEHGKSLVSCEAHGRAEVVRLRESLTSSGALFVDAA
jgi:predicted lipid-binding transport protein (Tim44 family)